MSYTRNYIITSWCKHQTTRHPTQAITENLPLRWIKTAWAKSNNSPFLFPSSLLLVVYVDAKNAVWLQHHLEILLAVCNPDADSKRKDAVIRIWELVQTVEKVSSTRSHSPSPWILRWKVIGKIEKKQDRLHELIYCNQLMRHNQQYDNQPSRNNPPLWWIKTAQVKVQYE